MKNLTLIIPAKNEAESLPIVLNDLRELNCNIMISMKEDDLDTLKAIEKYDVEIHYQTKKGYGNSLIEAIEKCKTELFCIFNADGSFEKNDLQEMVNLCKVNDYVYTSRYHKYAGSEDDTIITLIGNKIFSFIGKLLFSLKINDILYTFVMGKTEKFKRLKVKSDDFRFCVEFPIKMQIANQIYTSIPSYEKKRLGGKKKVNAFKDGFLILTEMLKLFIYFKIFRNKIIN